ncbi:MAG: polysaccharide biosynthesis protein [Thermosynechococcaceae cyanobacterium]
MLKQNILKLSVGNHYFLILDTLIFLLTPTLSLLIRLDGWELVKTYSVSLAVMTIIFTIIKLLVLIGFGFYRRYWRFASVDELANLALATTTFTLIEGVCLYAMNRLLGLPLHLLPHSIPLLDGMLSFALIGCLRFSIPFFERLIRNKPSRIRYEKILIVGAGSAGISLVREMQNHPNLGFEPIGFVDDNPAKSNLLTCGLRVLGNCQRIPELVDAKDIDRVIIAIPSASGQVIRDIVNICRGCGIRTSTLPSIHEILDGRVRVGSVREIKIEDLLRREPIQTDFNRISVFLLGKTVLITGAGGSIGSELCRQIYRCHPAHIILVGHGENSVFNIQQELEQLRNNEATSPPPPRLTACIADLRSPLRLEYIFAQYKPDVVFHAAAHKHVPLMELNPAEAITNNVQGTRNLLDLALQYDVKHFVMISTDKAVNPTSVMGASKRVAEMLVLSAAERSGKPFVVVRFGNVLGSRGSVIPTFVRQIEAGGPVTVTHPNMCRYFMTIPEAVQLVLQAAVISCKGQIFMLNMGQPVKIYDLAKDLIRLTGYEVGKDIDIVFTGMRPGEKLFEELLIPGENYEPTPHEKLLVVKNASCQVPVDFEHAVTVLCAAAAYNNTAMTLFMLEQLVQGYQPSSRTDYASEAEMDILKSDFKTMPFSSDPDLKHIGFCTNYRELEQAVSRHELQVFYQPIMLLEREHIVTGFEALLRWHHPQQGLMPSSAFLPFAEKSGMIQEIGWWGLYEVCEQLKAWEQQLQIKQTITVSINLSHNQLLQPDLIPRMDKIFKMTAVNTSQLRFEIPEHFLNHNPEKSIPILMSLKGLGIHLQIDNFGHSSLKNMTILSDWLHVFDSLKIDRSRVKKLGSDQGNLEFFRTALSISNQYGMELIATGIETPSQVMQLKTLQCKYGQGYFFLKPIAGKEVKTLIGTRFNGPIQKAEG